MDPFNNLCKEMQAKFQVVLEHIEQLQTIANSYRTKLPNLDLLIDSCLHRINSNITPQITMAIDSFLILTKQQENKLQLEPTIFYPRKTIADQLTKLEQSLNNNQNIVAKLMTDEDMLIEADETKLKLILNYLISNAIKFTPRGTITLSCDYKLDHQSKENILTFVVEDEGVGMTPDELDLVSKWFLQDSTGIDAESRTLTKVGVGLTVCKMLITLMGGIINVESTKQIGTKFTFSIKCNKRSALEGTHRLNNNNNYSLSKPQEQEHASISVNKPNRLNARYSADLMAFLSNSGDSGRLILNTDWNETNIGLIETWPQSLISSMSVCLKNPFPISIWWGPNFNLIYNDGYSQILGAKHPAVGKKGLKVWEEIEDSIGPAVRGALEGRASNFYKDGLLIMERNGFQEECYFIYTFCPIYDENMRVGGAFNIAVETTKSVLNTRRLQLLRGLGNANKSGEISQVFNYLSEVLADNLSDLPFTLMYLLDDAEEKLTLQFCTGVESGTNQSPQELSLGDEHKQSQWPAWRAINSNATVKIEELEGSIGILPGGVWPEPCRRAIVKPIMSDTKNSPVGVFIAGISPRLNYDNDYQSFIELVVNHIGKAIDTVRSYEAQRQRLEELAKIDQAKTLFFTNISHEFRTPLSLMLGPLADSLADDRNPLPGVQRNRQLMIQRNALRLLKLVNMILDFSRIEAGRAQVAFVPTDLEKLTRELCQLFSSLMVQSSLEYILEIQAINQPVYVDVDMWEKIVMNLVSNAYKFTLKGQITISLKQESHYVIFSVIDSGVGISEEELPNLFKRFHRIEGSQGRSFEGSGIGLAMIQELIKLHGGSIKVTSKLGEGTAFTVTLPLGSDHLSKDMIRQSSLVNEFSLSANGRAIVQEVTSWTDSTSMDNEVNDQNHDSNISSNNLSLPQQYQPYRILLADDNVDMRNYIKNILGKYWTVEAAADGEIAYSLACNNPPDLILSDIMMPRLDGFGLIKKIHANPVTKSIPIILLSARAGEESKVEGLGAGADDYLVKTSFSEKELLARVKNHLELGRLRARLEKEVEMKTLELRQLNAALYEFIDMICHEIRNPLHGITGSWELLSERIFSLEKFLHAIKLFNNEKNSADDNNNKDDDDDSNSVEKKSTDGFGDMVQYMNNIRECTTYQTRVMDEVVLLAKLYSNKFELSESQCHLIEELSRATKNLNDKARSKDVTIKSSSEPNFKMQLDTRCFNQIITTLLIHVIDIVKVGSTINIAHSINHTEEINMVRLTVCITSTNMDVNWKEFERLISLDQHSFSNRSFGSQYNNTGFSLAICNKLVTIMGGKSINVITGSQKEQNSDYSNNTVVGGFEFDIYCRVSTEKEKVLDNNQLPSQPKSLTHRALIVEDNHINQVLCRCLLKKQGYECDIANNGREALETYHPGKYDFIIMDVAMPELNGIEVTRRIRENESQNRVIHPVIIIGLSAYAQPEKILEAIGAGMNDYICKPATFDKLDAVVKKAAITYK
jgi:signal transduction histidine kinase